MCFFATMITFSSNTPLTFSLLNIIYVILNGRLRDSEVAIFVTQCNLNLILIKKLFHGFKCITCFDIRF